MKATVKHVMSTHVYALRENASFKEIATRLHELRVSGFPIIDLDGKVIWAHSGGSCTQKRVVMTRRIADQPGKDPGEPGRQPVPGPGRMPPWEPRTHVRGA